MTRSLVLVVPGPLDARTGGTIYDWRMMQGLQRRGWTVSIVELDETFPFPTPAALDQTDTALAAVRPGTIAIFDSLALGAVPDLVAREASRLRIVALVHLPLAATIGFDRDTAKRLEEAERRALHAASLVVVSGKAALPLLAPYALPPYRVAVVEPGTDPAPLASAYHDHSVSGLSRSAADAGWTSFDAGALPSGFSGHSGAVRPLELLCVATLNAGKGHEILLEALAATPHRNWHLTCAGSLTRDAATVQRLRAAVVRLGLEDRVSFAGDLDRDALESCYGRADLFVLATRQETYGMAVAEALAHGLPVVATRTGAIPDLVGDEAGLVVPVDDMPALADALARVLGDPALRVRLAEGARHVRDRLPTWDDAAARMEAALDVVVHS